MPAGPAPSAEEPATWTVAAAPLRQTTSVVGRIGPGHVTRVLSPAGGTVRALHFTYGEAVGAGAPLVETLSVAAVVEEVEVTKLRVGQPVRVTGDAFPGIELAGELVEVASHASSSAPGASARFPVRARLGTPAPDERRALRIGMSVDLHILVRDDPAVLTVSLAAVERSGDAPG